MFKAARLIKQQGIFACKFDVPVKSKCFNEDTISKTFGSPSLISLKRNFHQSSVLYKSSVKELPLPSNLDDLTSSEILNFSPRRNRDINGKFILSSTSLSFTDSESNSKHQNDDRIECYDCSGAVNLSSVTETNVPFPFISSGKPTHLNLSVSQWGQKEKYVSEDLNKVHPINSRQSHSRKGTSYSLGSKAGTTNFYFSFPDRNLNYFNRLASILSTSSTFQLRKFCLMKDKLEMVEEKLEKTIEVPHLSRKEKLKAAVKDYGAVVIVFHVSISLISLGCCYLIVASGIDLSYILKEFGADDGGFAAGTAAHFVIAYAVHKTLAPGRIAITLTAVPFVVKKLRKMGILKVPTPKL